MEMTEKDRMAIALAITGFTILSPERRAREIIRRSIWEDIEEHISSGDLYRARAGINFAIRYSDEANIFSFSDDDVDTLQSMAADVNREIEAGERAARESAEPPSAETGN